MESALSLSLEDAGGEGGTAEVQLRDWEFGGRNQEGAIDVRSDHILLTPSLAPSPVSNLGLIDASLDRPCRRQTWLMSPQHNGHLEPSASLAVSLICRENREACRRR